MKIQKNPELRAALYRHIGASLSKERPGWHLSDFVGCNWKTFFRKTGRAPHPTQEQNMIYWMGHAAQFFLAPVKPEDAKALEVDGILMTPDFSATEFAGYPLALAEMKSTRKSSRNFNVKDSQHYLMQMMGYCKGLATTRADLIMYFIHGDYSQRPPSPTLDCWTVEFTQDEIDQNWAGIKLRRDLLDVALATGKGPEPHLMLGAWECDHCECADFCEKRKGKAK